MALNFPPDPIVGQRHTEPGAAAIYEWDGVIWKIVGGTEGEEGGDGIQAGTPFTLGQLMEVSDSVTPGEAISSGITTVALSGHLGDGNIHVDHSGVSINTNDGLQGGGTIAATRNLSVDATVQRRIAGGTNGNLVSRDASGDVQDAGIAGSAVSNHLANGAIHVDHGTINIIAGTDLTGGGTIDGDVTLNVGPGVLRNVVEDTTPQLGGHLETRNFTISIEDASLTEKGEIGATATDDGVYFAHTVEGNFDPNDGGIICYPGELELTGSTVMLAGLKHGELGGRQVYVSEQGILYGVNPPETGWEDDTTDTGSYDLGTGTVQGPWVECTGLALNPVQDIDAGSRVDYQVTLWVVNKTTNRSGTIGVAVGINGADPTTPSLVRPVAAGFEGYMTFGVTVSSTAAPVTTADTLSVFARRESGEQAQFGVDLVGTVNNHSLFLSVPGAGGAGEINTPRNDGGGVAVSKDKEGTVLPFRTLDPTQFEQNGDQLRILDSVLPPRAPYGWAIKGQGNGTYPGRFVAATETATRLLAIATGGDCTVTVNRQGATLTGFTTPLTNGVPVDISPGDQTLNDADYLTLVVTLATADVDVAVTLVVN